MRLTPGVNPIKKFPSKIALFFKLDDFSLIFKVLYNNKVSKFFIHWYSLNFYNHHLGGVKTERVFPWLSVLWKNNKMEVLTLAQFGSTILGKIKIKNWASMSAGESEFFRERWAGDAILGKTRSHLPALTLASTKAILSVLSFTRIW